MNKSDLIAAIAESANLSKAQASGVVETLVKAIARSLREGESVSLAGFGTFSLGRRAARTGRNPRNGAAVRIAERKTVKFKASKKFLGGRRFGSADPMMDDFGPSDDGGPQCDDGGPY